MFTKHLQCPCYVLGNVWPWGGPRQVTNGCELNLTNASLSDIIGTERFYHIIRNFVDYLLDLMMFLCACCMHLKE